jgi:hypothetical protein
MDSLSEFERLHRKVAMQEEQNQILKKAELCSTTNPDSQGDQKA